MIPAFEPAHVARELERLRGDLPRPVTGFSVALSGGLDSTVLVTALARLDALELRAPLRAVHVDHSLQPESRRWAESCERCCATLGIECIVLRVDARASPGESPESAARAARYAAIADVLRNDELLLTAHHADDQLETVLLQLLRGGGLRGVAGMPPCAPFGRGWHARPLLAFRREQLATWARTAGLKWVDDPSNLDPRLDRNYLRHQVLPALRVRWPAAPTTVGRTAGLVADAAEIVEAVAASDLAALREGRTLPLARLAALPAPRRSGVLRAWLAEHGLPLPSMRTLAALERDLVIAADDRVPCARWQHARVYRYRGRLHAESAPVTVPSGRIDWRLADVLDIGEHASLRTAASIGRGLARERTPAHLEVRFRTGGEVFRPAGSAHHRPLRKWLQERGVLPWLRDRIPLLYVGDELVAVAGLGVSATLAAHAGEPAWLVEWVGCPALTDEEAGRDGERQRGPDA